LKLIIFLCLLISSNFANSECLYNKSNLFFTYDFNCYKNHTRLIKLKSNIYNIYFPIEIESNTIFDGNNSILISKLKYNDSIFNIRDKKNIVIKNLTIKSFGNFNESFSNGKFCGFSNNNSAININHSSNIEMENLNILGFNFGINIGSGYDKLVQNIVVKNSRFSNLGMSAIRVLYAKKVTIFNNKIEDILGNQTICTKNWINNAKFADGIYLENVESIEIYGNTIKNIKRIGIVFDNRVGPFGKLPISNNDAKIFNNKIYHFNDCRGTENNAGIWIEPWVGSNPGGIVNINIINNLIDNINSSSCKNRQYGIFDGANKSLIEYNIIRNINQNNPRSIGIRCSSGDCQIRKNIINHVYIGVYFNKNIESISWQIIDNNISSIHKEVIYEK